MGTEVSSALPMPQVPQMPVADQSQGVVTASAATPGNGNQNSVPGVAGYQPKPADVAGARINTAAPTILAKAQRGATLVSPVSVKVPHPLFAKPGGGVSDPTTVTDNGRRWMPAEGLAHYLRNSGHPLVSAADLIAFNSGQVHNLNGRQVFAVGTSIQVLPGAAAVARASQDNGFTVQAGVSSVVGGNVGGPASVYALTPVDSKGRPQIDETKIFYSIPGTHIVGTFKPKDMSMAIGLGGSVNLKGIVLFGNVRLEVGGASSDPGSRLTRTGVSVNGGILFPLLNQPGEQGGVAGAASVIGDADWGLIKDAWGSYRGF
jgi:hypothetical protein